MSDPRPLNPLSPRKLAIWVGVILLIPLLGWWTYGLFDLDEGFYAAVAAEMNRKGTWITPLFNGHPWYEKPILLYWFAKPAIALFGPWIGPRLPSVLATLTTYGLVSWFGNKRLGANAGTLAALVLGTSILFVGAGRMMLVDPLLVLSLTACFIFFWESLVNPQRPTTWRIASAASLGFAFLAKGPVGGIFFIAIAGFTAWRLPDLRTKFKGGWLPAIAVFLVVVASWYLPAYLIDRQVFVQKFIIEQNLARFAGGDEAHAVRPPLGLLYYLPILAIGFIPWSITTFQSWPRKSESDNAEYSLKTYLATWASVIFLFFTVSTTKLPHYILPCLPPLALLVGAHLAKKPLNQKRLIGFATGAITLSIIANLVFTAYHDSFHTEVQALATEARENGLPARVALYALAKNPNPNGEAPPEPKIFGIPIKINETSHPSLLLYLGQNALETDRFEDLLDGKPTLIFTRAGRLPVSAVEEAARHGEALKQVTTKTPQIYYRLYSLGY